MVGWHASLKWQGCHPRGSHQGEGKERWPFSSPSLTALPQVLDTSLCLLRQELLAGLVTKGKLYLGLSNTKTRLSLCPGGKSCFFHQGCLCLSVFSQAILPQQETLPAPHPLPPSHLTVVESGAFAYSLQFRRESWN